MDGFMNPQKSKPRDIADKKQQWSFVECEKFADL
jgi:hypothetical protein